MAEYRAALADLASRGGFEPLLPPWKQRVVHKVRSWARASSPAASAARVAGAAQGRRRASDRRHRAGLLDALADLVQSDMLGAPLRSRNAQTAASHCVRLQQGERS